MISSANVKKLKSSLKWSIKNWMTDHLKKRFTVTVKKESQGNRAFFVERHFDPVTLTLSTKVYVLPMVVLMTLTYSGKRAEREINLKFVEDMVVAYQYTYLFPNNPTMKDLYKWLNTMVDYTFTLRNNKRGNNGQHTRFDSCKIY